MEQQSKLSKIWSTVKFWLILSPIIALFVVLLKMSIISFIYKEGVLMIAFNFGLLFA